MNIRKCTSDDVDGVVALLRQLLPHTSLDRQFVSATFRAAIGMMHQHYLCATSDSRVIGFCSLSWKHSLWCQEPLAHIDELVVDNEFRGQGVGRRLVESAEEIAIANGCHRIELDSAFWREDAHRFYVHLGFEQRAHLFSKTLPSR